MDPLAEISRRWSPYNYVENNSVGHTDPDGMACAGCRFDKNWDPDTGKPINNGGQMDSSDYFGSFAIRGTDRDNAGKGSNKGDDGGCNTCGVGPQLDVTPYQPSGLVGQEVNIIGHTGKKPEADANSGGTPGWRVPVIVGANPVIPGASFSYPINGGAASEAIAGEAAVGYILTRYGGTRPASEYFSPRGTTIGARYLLKGTNTEIYEEFNILKPFGLQQTQIAGQNGLPTGGIQLRSSMPAGQLLNEGYIAPVESPVAPVEIPEFFIIP